ncbi:hypothetical protein WR25_18221 [Diploscapter pachys]|uniref:Uncharacterized protein n=1 Tax=Diploscapter pachys TaxID=2018661 RepID=A0A2A2KS44_9BILA|nr:hypothetical protein WR25_18221 [Diploscapter pachys]
MEENITKKGVTTGTTQSPIMEKAITGAAATGMEDMGMTIMDMGTEAMGMTIMDMGMEDMATTITDTDMGEEEVTRTMDMGAENTMTNTDTTNLIGYSQACHNFLV